MPGWIAVQKEDPWNVRVLPKVHFGVHPLGLDGVSPDDPDIVVLHHFLGSWKVRGGWSGGFSLGRLLRSIASFFTHGASASCAQLPSCFLDSATIVALCLSGCSAEHCWLIIQILLC